jgi:hypothetical protein
MLKRQVKESELSPQYQEIFEIVSGFLDGSSFTGNAECKNSLNGITYYGLEVYQYR